MIRFEHVSFGYSSESTITDVNFTLEKGSFTALIGANGAGKTTTAKLLRGLITPTSGTVYLDGTDMKSLKASALAKKMGFLFQNPDRQICRNTVRDELMFTLENTVEDSALREQLLQETLESLSLDPDADPFLISRGERQRVALASALVHQPEILILDEPTTGLDYKECTQIMEYVSRLHAAGVTVVMVCHDMEVVLDYAKQVVIMSAGKVLAQGETLAMFRDQALLESAALLPPQIIGLSRIMARDIGPEFGDISTVDAMADAIERRAAR